MLNEFICKLIFSHIYIYVIYMAYMSSLSLLRNLAKRFTGFRVSLKSKDTIEKSKVDQ